MHKHFYASGFLFHPASGQILLQTPLVDSSFSWGLFTTENSGEEKPIEAFERIVFDSLELTLSPQDIREVYDYFDEEKNAHHYMFYAIITDDAFTPDSLTDDTLIWLAFKQLAKTSVSPQDKQNIIVSQRVINAEIRENTPEVS